MNVLLFVWCLAICIEILQVKSSSLKNEIVSVSAKKETHSNIWKNDTSSKLLNGPHSKSSNNETYPLKNETEISPMELGANLTVDSINAQRARIAISPLTKGEKCQQSDIDQMKKDNFFLAKRFSDKNLGAICKRQKSWNDIVVQVRAQSAVTSGCAPSGPCPVGMLAPQRPLFTKAQQSFIDEVRTCKGIKCFEGKNETNMELEVAEELVTNAPNNETRSGGAMLQGIGGAPLKATPPKNTKKAWSKVIRREYRNLTDDERNEFHAALNNLKTSKIDGISKYDILVEYHAPSTSPAAHFGCAFLPWHREFLKQLEVAMRYENQDIFIPYWDSTLDKGLPKPCDSVFFSDSFMGEGNDHLSGPFSSWKTARSFDGSNDLSLKRECGNDGDLFEQEDVDYILTKDNLKDFCYCNDKVLEASHGMIHLYVGGYMSYIPLAPNDPIFFLHHCFVDYIWEQWRQKKQNRKQRENDYPPDASACGEEYDGDAPMKPFNGVIIKDGLSNSYTDELYEYAPKPSCPNNCDGPYLFCSSKFKPPRCLSKIKLGGDCKGYEDQDVCNNGKCIYGKCKSD